MSQDKSTTAINKKSKGFTEEERAAMKERAREQKAEERANKDKAAGESDVLAKIAELPEPERAMAERLHDQADLQRLVEWKQQVDPVGEQRYQHEVGQQRQDNQACVFQGLDDLG